MGRLTLPHYGGKGHYMKCSEQFGCSGECTDCEELDKIVDKLAEYEDREEKKPQTNADRIRAMSDEELAWELMTWRLETEAKHQGIESDYPNTQKSILEWLKQPAEDDHG
ncbi:MAG: hypothetical protein IIV61_07145 [Oscillospiraceae bacterium]|nr:hypothetical protein [Oscillospiraceae bacterium]